MILLIGSPCTGKTTIGKKLASLCDVEFCLLDTFINRKMEVEQLQAGTILSDEFIDETVDEFIRELFQKHQGVYEIPYHDYQALFNSYPWLTDFFVVGLVAPTSVLITRNKARPQNDQIPEKYIQRCQESIRVLRFTTQTKLSFFDTSSMSEDDTVKGILKGYGNHRVTI